MVLQLISPVLSLTTSASFSQSRSYIVHLYQYMTKSMHYAKPKVDCVRPAYLMRRGPLLAYLVFSNEKACQGLLFTFFLAFFIFAFFFFFIFFVFMLSFFIEVKPFCFDEYLQMPCVKEKLIEQR